MRRHKKQETVIPRTDRKQNSLNPLESYIIIPPAAVAYIQGNENPFPSRQDGLVQNTSEGLSTSIEFFYFFFSHTARIQPNKMHDTYLQGPIKRATLCPSLTDFEGWGIYLFRLSNC